MNRELVLSVLPDGSLLLEWEQTKEKISKQKAGYQEEIFRSFEQNPDTWLFYFGGGKDHNSLSPSIEYFKRFSSLFIHMLIQIPELETQRHRAVVEMPAHELNRFSASVPMMAGSEYVNPKMLGELWEHLGCVFSNEIQTYDGSAGAFFHGLNPRFHLVGQVYFHLVENRTGDQPFAFMATYSAGMGRDGKPRHLPLKNAINAFDDDQLVRLLSTVYRAAEKSDLVSDLVDTGELFHPLAWDAGDAFCF